MIKQILPKEDGQAMIVIALLIVGMLALLGLVVDGGDAYLQRRRMQNASDAAAYEGARILAATTDRSSTTDCQVRIAIETFAIANSASGTVPTNCSSLNSTIQAFYTDGSGNVVGTPPQQIGSNVAIPSSAAGVVVTATKSFGTFFLGVVGTSSGGVGANAKAAFGPINSPGIALPMAIQCSQANLSDCFAIGQPYNIRDGTGPGNFGWLSWDGQNNKPYLSYEFDPNSTPPPLSGYVDPVTTCPHIGINCWVNGLPGNKHAASSDLDKWLNKKVLIVIYDTAVGQGSHDNYHIVGFAEFVLTGYNLGGNPKTVTGTFVKTVQPGQFCTSGCMNTGAIGLGLIK